MKNDEGSKFSISVMDLATCDIERRVEPDDTQQDMGITKLHASLEADLILPATHKTCAE